MIHKSREMQKVITRNIKTILAGMMISLCWMAILDAQLPSDGLIAYYPFLGNLNDMSGNDNNAFGSYSPAPDMCGNLGYACAFQGSPACVLLPSDDFIGLNEYSYSLWFITDSLPPAIVDQWVLFVVGSPTDIKEQSFSLKSDGTLAGSGSNIGTNPSLTTVCTAPVQTGRWIHCVLTRDNTRMRIFVNGALMASISGPDSLTNNQPANYGSDNQTVTIGGRWDKASREFFVGAIDEVRIYGRALNEEEIKQLYYTECTLSEIFGPTEVCQGQQNVTFYVDHLSNASLHKWDYSGTGATIHENGNYITVDFANNATSGILTVTVTGDFIDDQSRSLSVHVNPFPSEAGIISGDAEVCQGDEGVVYQISAIDNAQSYNWSYSGTGIIPPGNSNIVSIAFSFNATSGNLTVAGNNACGDGLASSPFPVTVSQLPYDPGTITGESTVCQGQHGITYSIPVIQNATGYVWNYSGTGVSFTGNTNAITVDFDSAATSGDLTITGTNNCGNSPSPAVFPITVLSTPAEAGIISGENAVCLNQNEVPFSVPSIQYASYYLWEYSGTGATLAGNTNAVLMNFSGQATGGNLTVTGHNICGDGVVSPEFSITVSDCSTEPVEITIPNSFSPNGDGVNDVFFIRGLPENSTLIIFNRAGRKLFESLSYKNDWDGKDRAGNALASGTYWYVLSVFGNPEEQKGFVYLKR
jgi:gliding motility-associated-like protein